MGHTTEGIEAHTRGEIACNMKQEEALWGGRVHTPGANNGHTPGGKWGQKESTQQMTNMGQTPR